MAYYGFNFLCYNDGTNKAATTKFNELDILGYCGSVYTCKKDMSVVLGTDPLLLPHIYNIYEWEFLTLTVLLYSAGTTYVVGSLIRDAGNTVYQCILQSTGNTPSSSPTYWKIITIPNNEFYNWPESFTSLAIGTVLPANYISNVLHYYRAIKVTTSSPFINPFWEKIHSDVGKINIRYTSVAPSGETLLNGGTFNKYSFDYRELFLSCDSFINTTNLTFTLPDCQGQFIRGLDKEIGTDPEYLTRTINSIQQDNFVSHNHIFYGDDHLEAWSTKTGYSFNYDAKSTYTGNGGIFNIANTGTADTRPNNIVLNYFIKYL